MSVFQPIRKNIGGARDPGGEEREGPRYKGSDPALGFAFLGRQVIDVQDGLLRQLADQLVMGRLHRWPATFCNDTIQPGPAG
jgi:hypothetical protein